jgi:hypothetical protein
MVVAVRHRRAVRVYAASGGVALPPSVPGQLRHLDARARSVVLDAIGRQLEHEPLVATRHRKPLRPNVLAPWELRVGSLRVF